MSKLKLVGISGSLRETSTNRLLVREAAKRFGDAEFTEAEIRLPLFDEDIENGPGVPAEVHALADLIAGADAVVISSPEYNKGISGALKNALDWLSRTGKSPWADKPVAVVSAAAGRSGGERTQTMTRECLMAFAPRLVHGPEVMVAATYQEWNEDGSLRNERYGEALDGLMGKLRAEAERD